MILVYFRWPQPVDSATNRTVPICPQSRVSVLFCSLTSPALDRSAPNRGSPGGGGESPQASSIKSAAPWQACQMEYSFRQILSDVCTLRSKTRPARTALPVRAGTRWTHGGLRFCHPAVPRAVLELPRRSQDPPETLPRRPPLSRGSSNVICMLSGTFFD